MRLTVKIETTAGSMEFSRGTQPGSGYGSYPYARDPQEMRDAANELQGIANAISAMTNTTPVVQIGTASITEAAKAVIAEHKRELVERSKAGKKAAAERRNAS